MSRRIKILIGIVLAALLFTLGGTAVALADTGTGTSASVSDNQTKVGPVRAELVEKVAALLNIPTATVRSAVNQAVQEQKSPTDNTTKIPLLDRIAQILGISRADLDSAIAKAKAEVKAELKDRLQEKKRQLQDRLKEKKQELLDRFQQRKLQKLEQKLDSASQKAVDKGVITNDESKQVQDWWDARPPALDKLRGALVPPGLTRSTSR